MKQDGSGVEKGERKSGQGKRNECLPGYGTGKNGRECYIKLENSVFKLLGCQLYEMLFLQFACRLNLAMEVAQDRKMSI